MSRGSVFVSYASGRVIMSPYVFAPDLCPGGLLVTEGSRKVLFVNDSFVKLVGASASSLIGQSIESWLTPASRIMFESYASPLLRHNESCADLQLNVRRADGNKIPVLINLQACGTSNRHWYWNFHDASARDQMLKELLSARQLLEERAAALHTQVETDSLTGLPNRLAMSRRLNQELRKPDLNRNRMMLVFLDLDDFKGINDLHGHDVGDRLLKLVSLRLSASVRQNGMVARLGGDEFLLLIELDKAGSDDPEVILEKVLNHLSEPFVITRSRFKLSASLGYTLLPQPRGMDADQLIRQADHAMYTAKIAGKGRAEIFRQGEEAHAVAHNHEKSLIQSGLNWNQFELFYQPKVNMVTGELIGLEALIRWHHPDKGLTGPMDFLPGVEGDSLGIEIGRWVLKTALNAIGELGECGIDCPVSVNISGYHLQQLTFTSELFDICSPYGPDVMRRLELEVLESSAIDDINQVSSVIRACQNVGIRLALDDFGTGYSTLSHLRDLPVETLKIDQSFVRDMLTNDDDLSILTGIIGFGRAFNRDVIAEGVETAAHRDRLISLGCVYGQGYLFGRPMPLRQIPEWLAQWQASELPAGQGHEQQRAPRC